jgi:hypothetical protein
VVDPPSGAFAYFVDHGAVHEIHGDAVDRLIGNQHGGGMSLQALRRHVAAGQPSFVFPLKEGLRFGAPDSERSPGDYYKWVVSKDEPRALGGRLYTDVWKLSYLSLADRCEVHFVPGVGIIGEKYSHHGTVIEWDLTLVDYHLEDRMAREGEPGSRPEH